jgi:hypothetical protein
MIAKLGGVHRLNVDWSTAVWSRGCARKRSSSGTVPLMRIFLEEVAGVLRA